MAALLLGAVSDSTTM